MLQIALLIGVAISAFALTTFICHLLWREPLKIAKDELEMWKAETVKLYNELAVSKSELRQMAAAHRAKDQDTERTHLAALERIDQLTADKETLTYTCDNLWDALIDAVSMMPVPVHMRKRDDNGRFVPRDNEAIASVMQRRSREKLISNLSESVARLCDEVMANAVTDIVPKPHTLEHGMTVKNPTEDEVKDAIPILKLVTELGKGEVIHCSTSKERQSVRRLLHDAGMTWGNGDSYANKDHSDSEESEHCFSLSEGLQGSVGFFRRMGYTVHRASEFLLPPNSSSQG